MVGRGADRQQVAMKVAQGGPVAPPKGGRRPTAVAMAALFVAGLAAVGATGAVTLRGKPTPTYQPVIAAAEPARVVVPSTTTTVAPAPPERSGPIDVPADPYAPEDVVRIGTIEIPKLGLHEPLMHGVTLRNIDLGPSHWPGTAMPGEIGNVVVAGHRVTHTHPFRDIDKLVKGDEVWFIVGGTKSVYTLTSTLIVYPTDTYIADQTDARTATLFACHPPHSARQRYVARFDFVRNEPVGPES